MFTTLPPPSALESREDAFLDSDERDFNEALSIGIECLNAKSECDLSLICPPGRLSDLRRALLAYHHTLLWFEAN